MPTFQSLGDTQQVEIFIENSKISRVRYLTNVKYDVGRGETGFKDILTKSMLAMMKDSLYQFKSMLKTIRYSDVEYFNIGMDLLEKERAKYTLD